MNKKTEAYSIIKKYKLQETKVVEKIIYLPTGYAKGASISQKITSRNYRKNRNIGKKLN